MGIWGLPLPNLVIQTKKAIPAFLEKAFSFILTQHIDTEGIFRIPGDKKTKEKIITFVDATDDIEINESTNPFDICNTITSFISAIPKHLLIDDNCDRLASIKSKEEAKSFIDGLPYVNKVFSSRIFGFFKLVSEHHEKNKMTASNNAIILAPILIENPSKPTFIVETDILLIFFEEYSYIFSSCPSIDENGKWIPDTEFKVSIDQIMEHFFCQSSLGIPSLKKNSKEKEMKMCRKIEIEDKVIEDLLGELLVGNSSDRNLKKQPITPL